MAKAKDNKAERDNFAVGVHAVILPMLQRMATIYRKQNDNVIYGKLKRTGQSIVTWAKWKTSSWLAAMRTAHFAV